MLQIPLQSTRQFQQHFVQQLARLLQYDELGVFILVLANASMDRQIYQMLQAALEIKFRYFQQLTARFDDFPPDDLSVFRQLHKLGMENIQPLQIRQLDSWRLQYNQLRSFRPARNSDKTIGSLLQPFDRSAFHFNKTFLAREIIWKGQLDHLDLTLFYNKFPFADYHALALIDAASEKPQYLQQQDCEDMDLLLRRLSHLQGIGFAYNSLGAYASVNHQHWQMILSQQDYAVELQRWRHNGGEIDYVLDVSGFDSVSAAWLEISALQSANQAFNLLLRPHRIYLIKRRKQGECAVQSWNTGPAWAECAGQFTLSSLADFRQLQAAQIEQQLSLLRT
jgi:hypothetical protein